MDTDQPQRAGRQKLAATILDYELHQEKKERVSLQPELKLQASSLKFLHLALWFGMKVNEASTEFNMFGPRAAVHQFRRTRNGVSLPPPPSD